MSEQDTQTSAEQVLADHAAPQEGTSGPAETGESFTNFRLEDVPDEYRDHVKKAYDQMRADYSRKTGELAETRKSLGSLAERRAEAEQGLHFLSAINSEDQRDAALEQLVNHVGLNAVIAAAGGEKAFMDHFGIELEDNGDADEGDTGLRDPRVDDLLREREAEREAEEAAQEAAEQAAHLEQVEADIDKRIDQLAEDRKLNLTEVEKDVLWSRILDLGADDQDEPQVQKAFDELFGLRDTWIKSYRDSRKGTSAPPASGSSPSPSIDRSSPKAMRESALAVMNRTMDG